MHWTLAVTLVQLRHPLVEQVAAAARLLNGQSDRLSESMSSFRVSG